MQTVRVPAQSLARSRQIVSASQSGVCTTKQSTMQSNHSNDTVIRSPAPNRFASVFRVFNRLQASTTRQSPLEFLTKSFSTTVSTSEIPSHTSGTNLAELFTLGATFSGFTVKSKVDHPTLNMTVYTFSHASGAEYVHVERKDGDNAFCVAFRTLPTSDNGVAHVLEHTVLCGSEAYPVRDPFFLLLRRSLNTFMNAITRPEATYYPFSTQNGQDYKNLLSVYLDAVFFPKIEEMDFHQEGHRLEVRENEGIEGDETIPSPSLSSSDASSDTSRLLDPMVSDSTSKASLDFMDQLQSLQDDLATEDLEALEELQMITRDELDILPLPKSVKDQISIGFLSPGRDSAFDIQLLSPEVRETLLKCQIMRAAQSFSQDGEMGMDAVDELGQTTSSTSSKTQDPRTLEFKGVVYNEMKGALSDAGSFFATSLEKHLFTSPVYQHNSGGDPASILTLTHEQLLSFHRRFYHPSNACFMSYGDFAPLETMESVNRKISSRLSYLEELKYSIDVYPSLESITPLSKEEGTQLLREQERFTEPKIVVQYGPEGALAADPVKQSKFVLSWLCKDTIITDVRSKSLLCTDAPVQEWSTRFPLGDIPVPYIPHLDPKFQSTASVTAETPQEGSAEPQGDLAGQQEVEVSPEPASTQSEKAVSEENNGEDTVQVGSSGSFSFDFTALLAEPYSPETDITKAVFTAPSPAATLAASTGSAAAMTVRELETLAKEGVRSARHNAENVHSPSLADTTAMEQQKVRQAMILSAMDSPEKVAELNQAMEEVGLAVLSSLLLEQPASPLYELLSDPELGQGPAPYTGVETSMYSFPFCMGITGVHPLAVPGLAKRVFAVLEAIADTGVGLEAEKVAAMLHQIELSLKDVSSGFGVNILQRLVPVFATGRDIQAGLLVLDLLHLMQQTSDAYGSLYLRSLLKHHLLSNPHRLLYVMHADPRFPTHLRAQEEALLQQRTEALKKIPGEIDALEVQTARLKKRQDTPADPSCLPSLSVKDIAKDAKQYPFMRTVEGKAWTVTSETIPEIRSYFHELEETKAIGAAATRRQTQRDAKRAALQDINMLENQAIAKKLSRAKEVAWNTQPTNSIVMVRAVVDNLLDRLTPDQISLLPLFSAVFGRLGAGGKDYKAFMHETELFTGGIGFRTIVESPLKDSQEPRLIGMFSGKSLAKNAPKMLKLLSEMATSPDFTQHLYSLLTQYSGAVQGSLQDSGASYARKDAASRLPNRPTAIVEQYLSGLPNAQFVTQIIQRIMLESKAASDLTREEAVDFETSASQVPEPEVEPESEAATTSATGLGVEGKENAVANEEGVDADADEPIPSPILMKIANDLCELVRCLVLGPEYELEIGLLQHQTQMSKVQSVEMDAINAVSESSAKAAEESLQLMQASMKLHLERELQDLEAGVDNEAEDATASHETMASFSNRQAKLGAFAYPPSRSKYGFDRILVTADEDSLANPLLQSSLGYLLDSSSTVTPIAYRPKYSDNTEHFSMNQLKKRVGKKQLASRITAHMQQLSSPIDQAMWSSVERQRSETALSAGLPPLTPSEHGFYVSKLEATASPKKKSSSSAKKGDEDVPKSPFIPARTWVREMTELNGPSVSFSSSTAQKVLHDIENPSVVSKNTSSDASTSTTSPRGKRKNFIALPTQVNNVVMCLSSPNYTTADHAVLTVLAEVVTEGYLHREIREKGGAYGSFASQDRSGIFTLGSYRDPNVEATIDVLEQGLRWTRNVNNYTDRLVDEAKLSLFQSIDAPETPTDAGVYAFLRGTTQEDRQKFRTALLTVTKEQIAEVANRVFSDDLITQAQVSVVGSDQQIPSACHDADSEWFLTSLDTMLDAESEPMDPEQEHEQEE